MANVRIAVSKKGTLIAMIALVLLLGGGGGYLLWRVNQKDTVAPTDSDASEYEGIECTNYSEDCSDSGKYPRDENGNCPNEGTAGICQYPHQQYCCRYQQKLVAYNITYLAGSGGTVSPSGKQSVKPKGSISSTATPNSGYEFVKWSDEKTTASRTDSNVQADATYTATFRALQVEAFTLTYTAGTGGSISGTTPQTVNKGASGTQVTAVPSAGYVFDKWSDGKTTASRTDSNVQANATYTASFKKAAVDTFTLTYIAGEGGSINGSSSQTVTKGGNGSPVTAVANDGYVFDGWSDDPAKGATRTDKNVQASATYTASFKTNAACGDGMCTGSEDSFNCPADCGAPSSGKVPETAIFDNTRDTIIFGVVILVIGMAWTWISTLPKRAYTSMKTISKAPSEYVSNVKIKKEKNIRESRRNRLERRIK